MEAKSEDPMFSMGPNVSYKAKSVVMERKFKDGEEEKLVRWEIQKLVAEKDKKITAEQKKDFQKATRKHYIWMREDEMSACCPSLLDSSVVDDDGTSSTEEEEDDDDIYSFSPKSSPPPVKKVKSKKSYSPTLETDQTLREMKEDVRQLVERAKKLHAMESRAGGKILSSTVAILNAYAKMGSLTSVFQEFGAIDLLLSLLESRDIDVRKNASDMLRALAAFDQSIHSYVLLHLIKGEEGPESSLQSRQMLLDLFSETATSLKSDLKGVIFPQVSMT